MVGRRNAASCGCVRRVFPGNQSVGGWAVVEHLLASVAAHHREKNAEQVKNRMRARVQNGYWVFQPPVGYKYERKGGHGKILVPDGPVAKIVKAALEGFASGRFETQSEIKYFLLSQPAFPQDGCKDIHVTKIREMLERILYTGYMEYKPWGIPLQQGKHEPLINFDTYNRIQERLRGQAKAPVRKDIKDDFPLRGFVLCDTCKAPLTACWSAGRSGKYPYYLCRNRACADCKKSIRKEAMEEEFETILHKLTPTPDLMYITRKVVKDIWDKEQNSNGMNQEALQQSVKNLEHQIEHLFDRIVKADSETLIRAYETKVLKLETEKASLQSHLANFRVGPMSFDESFQTVFDFLENPQKLWHSDDLEDRRLVLKLVFTRPLAYRRNEGFQTASIALPFGLSGQFTNDNSVLVVQKLDCQNPTPNSLITPFLQGNF